MENIEQKINKLNKTTDTYRSIFRMSLFSAVGGPILGLVGIIGDVILLVPVGLAIAVIGVIAMCLAGKTMSKLQNQLTELYKEKRTATYEKELEENKKIWARGEWEFPCEMFYAECKEKGIYEVDSSFFMQKAQLLAKNYMERNHIPEEFYPIYISDELVKGYFSTGKEIVDQKENEEKRKIEEYNSVPHKGTPDEEQTKNITLSKSVWSAYGTEKLKEQLEDLIDTLRTKVNKLEHGKNSTDSLHTAVIHSAAHQEKTNDWAILGGIASGIAGPGAGMAVAMDAMEKNKQIEARNAQNRAAAAQMAANLTLASIKAEEEIEQIKTLITKNYNEIDALKEKVVLNVDNDTLRKSVTITLNKAEKTDTNVVRVSMTVDNKFVPDVPENVKIVVDGTVMVEVYAKDVFVGNAYIMLPMYGIKCGSSYTTHGYCENYMVEEQEYTIKVKETNLWAMEA